MKRELGEAMSLKKRRQTIGSRLEAAKKVKNKELIDKLSRELAAIDRSLKKYEEASAKAKQ